MKIPEQQLETKSNLESLSTEFSLTKEELENFKKLGKDEQEKQKQDKQAKIQELSDKLDLAIQNAIKTGDLTEARKLKDQFKKEIGDLREQIEITESLKLPEGAIVMEITPDPKITSAETAIEKLEAQGHKISDYAKDMLTKVNWKEKLNKSYEIISISVGDLFKDKEVHTYKDIKAKAKEFGLDLVPASLAPEIRSNYPKGGDWTAIAMEAIRDRDGKLGLFYCNGDGSGSWLSYGDGGSGGNEWRDVSRFFFVRK